MLQDAKLNALFQLNFLSGALDGGGCHVNRSVNHTLISLTKVNRKNIDDFMHLNLLSKTMVTLCLFAPIFYLISLFIFCFPLSCMLK